MNDEGDVKQDISGNHNTQINSGNDTIAAIGSGAIAAGRDIIINTADKDMVEILKKQINLLEEKLKLIDTEENEQTKLKVASESVKIITDLEDTNFVEFSPEKLIKFGDVSMLAGNLEIAEGLFKQAHHKAKMSKFGITRGGSHCKRRLQYSFGNTR